VSLTLRRVEADGLKCVGIEVEPFVRAPVMCIRDNLKHKLDKKLQLMSGEIYARSTDRRSTTKLVSLEKLHGATGLTMASKQ